MEAMPCLSTHIRINRVDFINFKNITFPIGTIFLRLAHKNQKASPTSIKYQNRTRYYFAAYVIDLSQEHIVNDQVSQVFYNIEIEIRAIKEKATENYKRIANDITTEIMNIITILIQYYVLNYKKKNVYINKYI